MEPGPSFMNMAEAMLHHDDYKSSHTSLNCFDEDTNMDDDHTAQVRSGISNTMTTPEKQVVVPVPRASSFSSSEKKSSEGRSVVIQVPPKRRKISTPFSPQQIVDGETICWNNLAFTTLLLTHILSLTFW